MNPAPAVLEENLARLAAARIRRRLRERGAGKTAASLPRLAVKFCGGCNPAFDRESVAGRIREELSEEARWVSADAEAELLLIINGCPAACADTPEIRSGRPAVVLSADSVSG